MLRYHYYAVLADLMTARDILYEVPGKIFDARFGVDTCGLIQIPDLIIPEDSRPQAGRYQPTKISVFQHVIQKLPTAGRDRFAFVDFGCGKGRCLLLAADAGFGKIVGVELSEPLCAAARGNASRYRAGRYAETIDLQCVEASASLLPSQPSIYFFYNPFGEQAMSATVGKIARHLDQTGDEAFIVYVNPMHRSAISGSGFELIDRGQRRSEEWEIWHRPAESGRKELSKAA